MEHDQPARIAEQSDDQVLVPVAPSRDTGVSGSPIIIDLRTTCVEDATADSPTLDTPSSHGSRSNGIAPSVRADQIHQPLQLVTVEDLQQSTRDLRRENAELTALINVMRRDMQEELAGRDRELAEVKRSSDDRVATATNQLAAAHTQIHFSGDNDRKVLDIHERSATELQLEAELQSARETHASDLSAAIEERDLALAARDEMIATRDRAVADRDAISADRDLDGAATACLTALRAERDDANQQITALQAERDDAHEQVTALQTERDNAHKQVTALQTERDNAAGRLDDLKIQRADTELQATTQLHAALAERDQQQAIALHERDVHVASLQGQLDQIRAEFSRAHESLAALTAEHDGRSAKELSDELAAAQAQLDMLGADLDERVQRAFEAGSQLGERAAERLARLLPADAN